MTKNITEYLSSPSIDLDEWKKIAEASLKDKTLEDLEKNIDQDIKTKPLYTSQDIDEDYSNSSRRGLKKKNNNFMPWYICSIIDHSNDTKILNSRIINELERGSNAIELTSLANGDLNTILNKVDPSIAPIYIKNLKNPFSKINEFLSYAEKWKALNKKEPLGGYQIDPIATNLWLGEFSKEKFGEFIQYEDILEKSLDLQSEFKDKLPKINVIHFDGSLWNDLGVGLSKEIELITSSFIEVFKNLDVNKKKELKVSITISADTDFFALIAKFRSVRIIFDNLFKHFNINGKLNITSRSSSRIIFNEDPWVNQLRLTTAALASAIGGADRIISQNITQKLGQAPEFIRRLTRNTHIILQEESRISRVQDPVGGSFYVESLTNNLARNVWKNIKLTEGNGGITSLLASKEFINNMRKLRLKESRDILDKKIKKIGVNIFEDPDSNPINVKPFEEVL